MGFVARVAVDATIVTMPMETKRANVALVRHLLGRAPDPYQIFGSASVQNTATDIAQLKAASSKALSAIQNRKDLEARFYASEKKRNQKPTNFAFDLLKLTKKLGLGMSEKALVDHIFVRLEPQVQVRNPQNTVQLMDVLATFEVD
ncbi:uncharacterized protein TNCV_4372171 [Trichonephila clavipes]|nr:uncharacterized protein TNCV_4372171 [Trichonephila clavipes]